MHTSIVIEIEDIILNDDPVSINPTTILPCSNYYITLKTKNQDIIVPKKKIKIYSRWKAKKRLVYTVT